MFLSESALFPDSHAHTPKGKGKIDRSSYLLPLLVCRAEAIKKANGIHFPEEVISAFALFFFFFFWCLDTEYFVDYHPICMTLFV